MAKLTFNREYSMRFLICVFVSGIFSMAAAIQAQHRLICQGKGMLAIVEADGKTAWEMNGVASKISISWPTTISQSSKATAKWSR